MTVGLNIPQKVRIFRARPTFIHFSSRLCLVILWGQPKPYIANMAPTMRLAALVRAGGKNDPD